jgi:histidinol phosphatase-like PHP family hydrolase
MAEAALARGYSYLAITDHSPYVGVANGLNRDRLLAQMDEIAALNREFIPRGLTLLCGQEVDILPDGVLDQDEDVLARLDIVVASVHRRHKETRDQMTARIVRAVRNPHVDILGTHRPPARQARTLRCGHGSRDRRRARIRHGLGDQRLAGAYGPERHLCSPR